MLHFSLEDTLQTTSFATYTQLRVENVKNNHKSY